MATAAEAAVNFARRRGAATTAKWQADYDAWQKRDLLLDAVVLSLQNGGGFKIPWRDDRRSASRVVSVLQTTPMILDYETRSTVAGRRLHLRICLIPTRERLATIVSSDVPTKNNLTKPLKMRRNMK
jgi:hypothetical protein